MEPTNGYDHLCMSLCIVVVCYWWFFWFCLFLVVGGVDCVFMCDLVVDWVRLCFGFVF